MTTLISCCKIQALNVYDGDTVTVGRRERYFSHPDTGPAIARWNEE